MSDFDHDWGMEHDLHVDHDGGVDHGLAGAHLYDEHHDHHDPYGEHHLDGGGDHDGLEPVAAHHEEPLTLDEPDLDQPDWQLDTAFLDGHYDLVGADPGEHDMWSQFMTDMHEEINPYAAS